MSKEKTLYYASSGWRDKTIRVAKGFSKENETPSLACNINKNSSYFLFLFFVAGRFSDSSE